MSKKIIVELTDQEYESLTKVFDQSKKSKIMPSKSLNIDDFCKEIITTFIKGPSMDQMKDLFSDLKDQLGGLGNINLEDLFGSKKQEPQKTEETKKEEISDDQKYKS